MVSELLRTMLRQIETYLIQIDGHLSHGDAIKGLDCVRALSSTLKQMIEDFDQYAN